MASSKGNLFYFSNAIIVVVLCKTGPNLFCLASASCWRNKSRVRVWQLTDTNWALTVCLKRTESWQVNPLTATGHSQYALRGNESWNKVVAGRRTNLITKGFFDLCFHKLNFTRLRERFYRNSFPTCQH